MQQSTSKQHFTSQQPGPMAATPCQPENLNDRELLSRTRQLVQHERELLTDILHHLKEVERRKLYSDLGFKSLFDYAVGELGYSEGAELLGKLEEVRALLGPKALGMSFAQLIEEMAGLSLNALKDKKFGKKRQPSTKSAPVTSKSARVTPTLKRQGVNTATTTGGKKPKARSIAKSKRYRVWERDGGCCVKCGTRENLQVDHIVPVTFGGSCEEENLRLLCGNCNAREGIKNFGLEKMKRARGYCGMSSKRE